MNDKYNDIYLQVTKWFSEMSEEILSACKSQP